MDNSDVAPTRLTAHPTLLILSKQCLPHLSSNEDYDGPSCIHVPTRGLSLPFAGEARASVLVASPAILLTRRSQTHHGATPSQATLPRRLPRLSSLLHPLVCCGTCSCACAPPFARSKAGGELPNTSTPRGSLVPTTCARTTASPMREVHALAGDGTHGQAERIQTFRGPACRSTFSARRDTPLYRLKTPSRAGSPSCGSRASRRAGPFRG